MNTRGEETARAYNSNIIPQELPAGTTSSSASVNAK